MGPSGRARQPKQWHLFAWITAAPGHGYAKNPHHMDYPRTPTQSVLVPPGKHWVMMLYGMASNHVLTSPKSAGLERRAQANQDQLPMPRFL